MTRLRIVLTLTGVLLALIALALVTSSTSSAAGAFLPTVTPAGGGPANDLIVFLANDDGEYQMPDGSFAFIDGGWDIYTVRLDGSDFQQLTNTPGVDENYPVLSPDGTQIAFQRWGESLNTPLYVMDADGANERLLVDDGAQHSNPTWSPDGTRLAYNARGGSPGVVVIDVESGTQTVLAEMDYMIGFPVWSPDGSRIAFTGHLDGTDDVWVVNTDGTGLVNVSDDPDVEYGPYWFPDGETLHFTRWDGESRDYITQADGSGDAVLAERPVGPFSPDGAQMVTVEWGNELREMVIYDADGTNPRLVFNTASYITSPRWSSDGAQIVYFGAQTEKNDFYYDLYVVDAAGGEPRRLTYTNSAVTGSGMFP